MNDGKICISVCASSVDDLVREVRRAEPLADIVEVRFDCLERRDLSVALESLPSIKNQYLFTYRPAGEGGRQDLTLDDRIGFWKRALTSGHDPIIDLEGERSLLDALTVGSTPCILSRHDLQGVPRDIDKVFASLSGLKGGCIVKIAVTVDDAHEAIPLWRLVEKARRSNRDIIAIGMGDAGVWTRILGPAHGTFLTFASLDPDKSTAPGQITAADMIDVYRVRDLDRQTRVYGVIGDPVSRSLSPYVHNAAFVHHAVNAVFLPLQVKDVDAFMSQMVMRETREIDLSIAGFAVTMPHKLSIMKWLDAIDPVAAEVGAVNTVSIDNGRLIGHNTDADGFIGPLTARFPDLQGMRVAIVGAGGAGRACIFALKREKADVCLFVRDAKKARPVMEQIGIESRSLEKMDLTGFDVLVNATPVGMRGTDQNLSVATASQLGGLRLVYDLVTSPTETVLSREATTARIPTINGVEMLVEQAALQYKIWTGEAAPLDVMRSAALKRISR